MKIKKIKIKDWEVCCNNFVQAVIADVIDFRYDGLMLRIKDIDIFYCPFCGKPIDYEKFSESEKE